MKFPDYPFFTEKGYILTKSYTPARTSLGLGEYAAYKDFGEESWKIGYGSKELHDHALTAKDRATQKEIDKQFFLDLREFSNKLKDYVFVNLNKNRKAAILSFAHSIGIQSFKNCRLLDLINSYSSKTKIIKEWSPYINTYWMSGGDLMIARRRAEVDMYFCCR